MFRTLRLVGPRACGSFVVASLFAAAACSSDDVNVTSALDGGDGTGGAVDTGGTTGTGGRSSASGGRSTGSGGKVGSGGVRGVSGGANGGAAVGGTDGGPVADGSAGTDGGTAGNGGAGGAGTGGAIGTGGAGTGGAIGTGGAGTGGAIGAGGAGTGGKAGTGGAPPAPLAVYDTTPTSNATDVAPDTAVNITFTQPLNGATVGSASFTFRAGVTNVAGAAAAAGATLTFTPSRLLELGTTYTAGAGTAIASSAGAHLDSPFAWTFSTRRWGIPAAVDLPADTEGSEPCVTVDPSGNALVAWLQVVAGVSSVWANRYDAATNAWGTPQRLDGADFGPAGPPRIAGDASGNAWVVWAEPSGTALPASTWAARYKSTGTGAGWAAAALVETDDTGETLSPNVVMDGAGNAVALWNQKDGAGIYTLWSSRSTAGGAWAARVHVETDHIGIGGAFDLGTDPAGNALAVWTMAKGGYSLVYASRSVPGSPWTAAVTTESTTQTGNTPQVALDAAGNALAVWTEAEGARYVVWAARYAAGTGWQAASKLQTSADTASYPRIAMDSAGNGVALWNETSAAGNVVWSDTYAVATHTWKGAALLTNYSNGPAVAVSANGHAAVAVQSGGVRALAGPVTTAPAAAWGATFPLDTPGSPSGADVAVNDTGTAFAVWVKPAGASTRIWANRFR